jgi:hypothetical protein
LNGGGVIGAKAGAAPQPVGNALNVDDRSCIDMPAYKDLGCYCWNVGTLACPADAPEWCRNCTKVSWHPRYFYGCAARYALGQKCQGL